MKLHYKIALNISLLIMIIVIALSFVVYSQLNAALESQMEYAAMDLAHTISAMSQVQSALEYKSDPQVVQTIIEPIRRNTRYQYIIVMDMDGIQYSYPNQSGLGKPYKNGGEEQVLESGEAYLSADNNELIASIRAFAPVYYQGDQVGAVLIGLLTDQVRLESNIHKRSVEIALVISIMIGVIVALLLSFNIKKSIFGLEPKEIALLLSEKELVIQSLERGVLAVDTRGSIILSNLEARKTLGLPAEAEGHALSDYEPDLANRLGVAIEREEGVENETFVIGGSKTVLISICLMRSARGTASGVVVSMDDLMQVRAFAEEITDYRALVDALRAQNHEFMNRLHTLSGLIQLGYHDEAVQYVEKITAGSAHLNTLLTEQIRNHKLAGLLLSKYSQLAERRVALEVSEDSFLEKLPPQLDEEDLCAIVGNLIDNSADSLKQTDQEQRRIDLLVRQGESELEIEVFNNGPEIEKDIADLILMKGFSTKENGQGIGLYLVDNIIRKAGGQFYWENDKGVVWHVTIPYHPRSHRGRRSDGSTDQ